MAGTIKRLTPTMTAERAMVASIHAAELPDSELSVLGEAFLYRFYYGALLEDPEYFCYVYCVDGTVAGFTAFTTDVANVCRRAVRRSWPALAGPVAARIMSHPGVIATCWTLARSFLSPQRAPGMDIAAEALSTAVAEPYRSVDYFHQTGVNVAQALYLTIARVLHELGVGQVKGWTRKSNIFVNASLSFLGWEKVSATDKSYLWVWKTAAAVERFHLANA